jgi:hypothetical protein
MLSIASCESFSWFCSSFVLCAAPLASDLVAPLDPWSAASTEFIPTVTAPAESSVTIAAVKIFFLFMVVLLPVLDRLALLLAGAFRFGLTAMIAQDGLRQGGRSINYRS